MKCIKKFFKVLFSYRKHQLIAAFLQYKSYNINHSECSESKVHFVYKTTLLRLLTHMSSCYLSLSKPKSKKER